MSFALLERAKKHRSSIGDHGDPYGDSLDSGIVSIELKIIVKEIFDHLRSALDYSARELVMSYSTENTNKNIYFPIVSKLFLKENFKGRIGQLLPGIIKYRPDLINLFESFQPFTSSKNDWIADLATLCNQNKHEHLSIINCSGMEVLYSKDDNGMLLTQFLNKKNILFNEMSLMRILSSPENDDGIAIYSYILFDDVQAELLTFLDSCLNGVENILQSLSKL